MPLLQLTDRDHEHALPSRKDWPLPLRARRARSTSSCRPCPPSLLLLFQPAHLP